MIIIHVTLNSGKKVQFPYPATNPISEIYKAVSKISDEAISSPSVALEALCTSKSPVHKSPVESPAVGAESHIIAAPPSESIPAPVLTGKEEIKREDLVKCIKVEPRAEGSTVDIEVGKIYRVLKVHGPILPVGGVMTKIIDGFDVVDDNAATARRIFAAPSEMEFYQKRKVPPVKIIGKMESTFSCPTCHTRMVAYKEEDGKYHGECVNCLQTSTHELSKPKEENGSSNTEQTNQTPKDLQAV